MSTFYDCLKLELFVNLRKIKIYPQIVLDFCKKFETFTTFLN